MGRNANRVTSLLRQRRIVDNQPGILAPDHFVRFGHQRHFKRRAVPDSASDEMMKLVVVHDRVTRRHRLHALAVPWTDQASDIGRTHPSPRLVSQSRDKRLKPVHKFISPTRHIARSSGHRNTQPHPNLDNESLICQSSVKSIAPIWRGFRKEPSRLWPMPVWQVPRTLDNRRPIALLNSRSGI